MGALIWVIVLIIIASSVVRNSAARRPKGKPGGADTQKARPNKESPYVNQPNQPKSGTKTAYPIQLFSGTKTVNPNRTKPGMKSAKPNQPKPGTKTAKPNQQKADQVQAARYTSVGGADNTRYGSYKQARQQGRSPSNALHQTNVDDILESARENTQAVQLDNDMDTIEIGDLMAKVQDNIVMGPVDTLTFQRDFVAEGMDMLNRYTMIPGSEA